MSKSNEEKAAARERGEEALRKAWAATPEHDREFEKEHPDAPKPGKSSGS